MAGYVTRDGLLGRFALAEEEYTSEVFGGTLVLREETRAAFRAVRAAAGEPLDADRWNAGHFCAGVVDPHTKQPIYTMDEILSLANRPEVWMEILHVAGKVLTLSEARPGDLKSGGAAADAG